MADQKLYEILSGLASGEKTLVEEELSSVYLSVNDLNNFINILNNQKNKMEEND